MLFVLSIPLPLYPSIHLSIYLSFSREEKRKNSRANASRITIITIIRLRRNSSPPITIFHPSSLESTRKTSCGPVSSFGRVTPSPSRVRSGQWSSFHPSRPPLVSSTLACRTRVARLVGNASSRRKVARGGGGGEKKGTKERNGYRERAGALPGKNEGGGGRRRHEAGTERFPPNNHGNNSQEWNTCQIKGLESSKVPR